MPDIFGGNPLIEGEVAILAVVLLPLFTGYAIMRHQFMGIRRLVHRGAAYVLISVAVLVLYSGMIATLGLAGGADLSDNATIQVLLLMVLFSAVPFISGTRRLAFAAVDRLLYREFMDYPDLTRRLSVDAAYAQHVDDLASSVLGTIVDELRLTFAAFLEISGGASKVMASAGSFSNSASQRISATALLAQAEGQAVSKTTMATEHGQGEAIVVTLKREAQAAWMLCLGPKLTEEPFLREDLELAQSVTSHVATIVEKLELLDRLETKTAELRELNRRLVDTQETERARIASYLHDDPLQQITNVIWRYSDNGLPPKLQQELQHIAESLRNFSARLQPGVLEDLGMVRALEWLGAEAAAEGDFQFVFHPPDSWPDGRLTQETELALYRIAQEALTNSQRHSNAKTVWLTLLRNGDKVDLIVEDDGVGLQPVQDTGLQRRLGLVGMRERAEQLGGKLEVSSTNPLGTRVVASLPLKYRARNNSQGEVDVDDQGTGRR